MEKTMHMYRPILCVRDASQVNIMEKRIRHILHITIAKK
uniref:Uncharacterized protein n=1 Tax=Arundo donax TaxID=35708 RepID=A0A0A8Y274_ARUDO